MARDRGGLRPRRWPAAGESYRETDVATILAERERAAELLGPGDHGHLLSAMALSYRFVELNAEVFDNTRLLKKECRPPRS